MAGWGITNITTQQTAKILKYVQVMVMNSLDCKAHWKAWFSPQSNICAGNTVMRQDACQVNENLQCDRHYCYLPPIAMKQSYYVKQLPL